MLKLLILKPLLPLYQGSRKKRDHESKKIQPTQSRRRYALERFGFDRVVYGGDWPVVLLAGAYRSWSKAFEQLTRSFPADDLQKLYHLNADRVYRL